MLQKKYIKSQEQQIVSYNYNDIAEGTGIITFLPFTARNAAGAIYRMSQQALYSENVTSSGTFDGSSTKVFDKTFRLNSFNKPQTIGGTAYFVIPVYVEVDVSNDVMTAQVTVTVQKSDGTTSTDIVEVIGSTLTGAAGVSINKIFNIEAVIPQTHFKIGEYLQVQVEVTAQRTSGSGVTHQYAVGHDPQNRDGTYITVSDSIITKMSFDIPFRLDL